MDVSKYLAPVEPASDARPWHSFKVTTFEGLVDFLAMNNEAALSPESQAMFFRGQGCSEWTLKPKLLRRIDELGLDREKALALEYDSILYFRQTSRQFLAPNVTPEKEDLDEWLGLMQHYSAPTRVLDWSMSLYVALYFVVSDLAHVSEDGALWCFPWEALAQVMARHKALDKGELAELIGSRKRFVSYGQMAEEKIALMNNEYRLERMIPQKSVFTVCYSLFCDHALVIGKALRDRAGSTNSCRTEMLVKFIIPAELKKRLLAYLVRMDICAATLFPGMDGIGRSIAEMMATRPSINTHAE